MHLEAPQPPLPIAGGKPWYRELTRYHWFVLVLAALGWLQASSAFGNMMAAVITMLLAQLSWRALFVVGALPAFLCLLIMRKLKEPERWAAARKDGTSRQFGSFKELFGTPRWRHNAI